MSFSVRVFATIGLVFTLFTLISVANAQHGPAHSAAVAAATDDQPSDLTWG